MGESVNSISSLDFVGGEPLPPVSVRESAYVDDFARGGWGYGLAPFNYNRMPWWAASGTGNDRKGGRDLPLVWNELDLRGFRLVARDLDSRNQFAIGFLNILTAYHIHKGYGWQVCRKGARKTAYPTARTADALVSKAQSILDTWRDANRWPLRSREAFRRWRRDGEVFGRFFMNGWDRLPAYRTIDPELIGSPTGDTDGDGSFGILSDPDDVESALAYYVNDRDSLTEGEWVTANRKDVDYVQRSFGVRATAGDIVHVKANVDSNIKRGITDFLPVAEQFDGCRIVLRNMLASTARQSGTAWLEKIPAANLEIAAGIVPQYVGVPHRTTGPNDPYHGYRGYGYEPPEPPGSVKKTEDKREYVPVPGGGANEGYKTALQASLRGCCVRWGLPEFASGDASNNNFASALVSNAPFTRTVEGTQYEWGATWERPIALKVLDLAVEAGLLTRQERAALDVEVTEPLVASAEPDKDAQTNNTLHQAGVLSSTTWRLKLGLDPQHETENFKQEEAAKQPAPPAPVSPESTPPASKPDDKTALDGLFESVVRENFTGTITDAAGHKRSYVDGKPVAAKQDGAKQDTPTSPHTGHAATDAVQKALAGADLTPEKREEYTHAANLVLARMPKFALDRAAAHVATTAFYPSPKELGLGAIATAMRVPGLSDQQRARLEQQKASVESGKTTLGGAYITKEGGQLHLDGGMSGVSNPGVHGGGSQTTHEVYAHEFGHAIDGPNLQISNSVRWREAFDKEIGPSAKAADGTPRLTKYAQTNAQEGLAEFCRLVYSGTVPLERIEQEFPIASKFFKEAKLWAS